MTPEHQRHWGINWKVDDFQIKRTIDFYNQHSQNVFVRARDRRNIQKIGLDLSKEFVWKSLVSCLLTTQQRSGPTSNVAQLLRTAPFPLTLQFCLDNLARLDTVAQKILSDFGGIRRSSIIAQQLRDNLQSIISSDWSILKEITHQEGITDEKVWEQSLANVIQKQVNGFGPKQSRNFLQILGVTKYEIPLDSRIMDWLNQNNFPIHLTASGLSDPYYYKFISDGIQYLCEQANIYPCLLDAAIFSSYDNGKWTEENLVL
jgi:thermostable 8-oxoguanine DNA glycosylase